MDIIFDAFFQELFVEPPGPDDRLLSALRRRQYPTIYALLRKRTEPLSPEAAAACCSAALGCTPRVLEALLDHCPPLSTFLRTPGAHALTAVAAARDRPQHLKVLLDRGASPNEQSPLVTAIAHRSLRCVKLLLDRPDLDTALTPALLEQWARIEHGDTGVDWCIQALIPRFLGQEWNCFWPMPIPAELRLEDTADWGNWPLAVRVCRELSPTPGEMIRVLSCINYQDMDVGALAELLDAMFTACPALLRRKVARAILAACALAAGGGVPDCLRPWLERMPGREIVLIYDPALDWFPPCGGTGVLGALRDTGDCLLARWRDRLGERFVPVLERDCRFPILRAVGPEEGAPLLRRCRVRGRPVPGRLSRLARQVLMLSDPALLAEQLRPGGVLYGEDPGALLALSLDPDFCTREKRAVLLTCVKKEDTYEL